MPYANGYDNGHSVWNRKKGFVHKASKPEGFIPFEAIPQSQVDKYNLKIGDITPFSNCRIADLKINFDTKPFLCTYCGTEMTYDSSEGIGYDEVHIYNCPECNCTLLQHENLSEDTWYEGE